MYPYLPEDFSVMVMDLSDSLLIVRVDLPVRDMGVPSCFRVYFAWNDETQEGRYFLRLNGPRIRGKHLLGEFKKKTGSMLTMERLRQGSRVAACAGYYPAAGRKLKEKSVSGK